jgi:DNA topoisomerase-1
MIDFIWGINFSRALSQSGAVSVGGYRTLSVGRVQGPTLAFVAEREVEIQTFVSRPYWTIEGVFERGDGKEIVAAYSRDKVYRKAEVESIRNDCIGKMGRVDRVARSISVRPAPPPFNIGDLQKESYRCFGYSPSRTLSIAERLYLDALSSYPRTNSQKLPPSINYGKILQGIGALKEYSADVSELQKGELRPSQGGLDDSAHPAIHPTGERPRRPLDASEARVYDLIVRRFLATFAIPAKTENVTVIISVNGHRFRISGRRTLVSGWLHFYGKYAISGDVSVPVLNESDELKVVMVEGHEKFEPRPYRFNQSSLLEKMERERLGTKATRAETISTLVARGYISGENLVPSDLGFAVVETMKRYAPSMMSVDLTRRVEEKLERIEKGFEDGKELVRGAVREISDQLLALASNREEVGRELGSAVMSTIALQNVIGVCPVCKTGKLKVIRSKKTRKRFVGCTNYGHGCRASAPLPQKGIIRAATKPCRHCSWPVVYVRMGRFPWKLCVNPNCPSKAAAAVRRKHEVPAL